MARTTKKRFPSSPFNDGNQRSKRSSKNNVLLVFTSLVFICCAINLRLHFEATVVGAHHLSENGESSDDDAVYRVVSPAEGHNKGAKAPTWSPITLSPTTSTWSPTAENQTSWVPTYGTSTSTTIPSKSLNVQTSENGFFYINELSMAHPRVACFIYNNIDHDPITHNNNMKPEKIKKGTSCGSDVHRISRKTKTRKHIPSIPTEIKPYNGPQEDMDDENYYAETDTCKYPDPSNHATATAPPTCNDIHSLGFDPGMFENRHHLSSRVPVKYITMGGAKCVWKVTNLNGQIEEENVIFKSHKNSRFLKRLFWDQNRKDALISGGMGNSQLSRVMKSQDGIPSELSSWNHVLPLYHYCGLANIVPMADGNLEEYINYDDKKHKGRRFGPTDTLRVALQAARGLYQAQMHWGGKPTFVHADVNPSQFLVFNPHSHESDKESSHSTLPILQINDFNQGRFLTRSIENNETCPFRSCTKNVRGNRWHTPERFIGCVDQDDLIDTFSLGSVFFFLLTNGFEPHYDVRSYGQAIKNGDLPHIPRRLDLDHPAYDILKEVMLKCLAFKLSERPSSLEVVQMLEAKLKEIER